MSGSCRRVAAALPINLGASMAQAQSSQIDVETGGRASHYVDTVTAPAGNQPCTVLLGVARLGPLEPVTDGCQLAIDTDLAVDKATPDYNTGRASMAA